MTDAAQIVEDLINTDGIHAFVFVCEAADKYLPMIDSVGVVLANGKAIKATEIDRRIALKVDETRKTLKREDRIVWALRFLKKSLIEQLIWMIQSEPQFFQRRFKSPPAPEQPLLTKQLQKLNDVDISPFQEFDADDFSAMESPYSVFSTVDAINERIGHYLKISDTYGATEPGNVINSLRFERQSFGEVISIFRREEVVLRRKRFPGGIKITPSNGPYDLQDKEGPIETVVEFPNGWRWLDLHRSCSPMRDDRSAASDIAITGHCANTASQKGETAFELVEPLGNDLWKHHAFFIMHAHGLMGEMKGRKNQKPSPRLEKYIFELLRHEKRIKGFGAGGGWNPSHDFSLADLTKPHLDILRKERPQLFGPHSHAAEDE